MLLPNDMHFWEECKDKYYPPFMIIFMDETRLSVLVWYLINTRCSLFQVAQMAFNLEG